MFVKTLAHPRWTWSATADATEVEVARPDAWSAPAVDAMPQMAEDTAADSADGQRPPNMMAKAFNTLEPAGR
jgi:hypothetical protein